MALFVVLARLFFQLLFGIRSSEAVAANLVSGLKLAVWILAFGVLNLFLDFRKFLNFRPRFFKTFTTALTISLSLTPTVAQITSRIRNASKLRAFRHGLRRVGSIAVPVLSSAIDQAINLADSMETRSSSPNLIGKVSLRNLTFAFKEGIPVLQSVDLDASPGTISVIHGNTGSGKSTLLKVIAAKVSGAAYVGQFPRDSFVAASVRDEISFAPRQQGKSKAQVEKIVSELVSKFELAPEANLFDMSSGWQQRLAIAAALANGSKILLLDEPFSALDRSGAALLTETLKLLRSEGITIIVVEHRIDELLAFSDHFYKLENGALITQKPDVEKLLPMKPISGSIKVIFGENGSGKTTYLNELAKSRGVLVPQPASDLLFLDSIQAELEQADSDAKNESGFSRQIFESFVPGFNDFQNPRDLSEGQKLALAISIQLASKTNFLMLDEPTLGFDLPSRTLLGSLLCKLAESGVEILVATHDQDFAKAFATETIHISQVANDAK